MPIQDTSRALDIIKKMLRLDFMNVACVETRSGSTYDILSTPTLVRKKPLLVPQRTLQSTVTGKDGRERVIVQITGLGFNTGLKDKRGVPLPDGATVTTSPIKIVTLKMDWKNALEKELGKEGAFAYLGALIDGYGKKYTVCANESDARQCPDQAVFVPINFMRQEETFLFMGQAANGKKFDEETTAIWLPVQTILLKDGREIDVGSSTVRLDDVFIPTP